ncbi:competence protein CoiA [Oceanobacillus halotolerans]|uniref:competence protein CoiA n=1 Tax=Oceanobacillus halotolerans TaxID=2663380 RepID=UPI0013DA4AE6|nr:competence protein CoiA family protein [Oceanobacillus halotolerans]
MLQAKTKEGRLVTLAKHTRIEIETWKETEQFYCPACNEAVMIKAGRKMIPHFSHYSQHTCPSNEKTEGAYHEQGKLKLYEWLQSQKLNVQLEIYLPDIQQRPDLLVTIGNKTMAFEYQCAKISTDEIIKRSKGYRQAGIVPIWIIGANQFKRKNQHMLRLNPFTRHLIHQFSSITTPTLFYFCPTTNKFIQFQHIIEMTPTKAIGTFTVHTLREMRFTSLFQTNPLPTQLIYTIWNKEKILFRQKPPKRVASGLTLKWQRWLYQKQTHPIYLPSIVYLPVKGQYRMKTPPWDWQSRLCIDIIDPLPLHGVFSIDACYRLLRTVLFQSNTFPLRQQIEDPIRNYLDLLGGLMVIKQVGPEQYQKRKSITFHSNIEQAIRADQEVMKQLIKIKNKIQA